MTLTFEDERADGTPYDHVICVGMPKKKVFDILMNLDEMLADEEPQDRKQQSERRRQMIDDLYNVVALILSNNMNKEKITSEWVGEQMSLDEVKMFLKSYSSFIKGEAVNPN